MCPQPWLVGVKRRTLEDIKEFLRPSQIYRLITAKAWPYKGDVRHGKDLYEARDKALLSLLYLTCGRITEVLSLRKSQFVFDEDPDFIIVTNMIVVKRKKKQRKAPPIRAEVPLAREGPLAKFTELVEGYLRMLEGEDARLFEFGRRRAWQIVKFITGKWCHFFRSQGESWYGKIYDVFGLKEFVKVTSIETLGDYVQAPWRQYRNKLLGR